MVSGRSQTSLLTAITLVLRSGLPGQPPPARSAVDVVLGARSSEANGLPLQARAAYTSALVWARIQTGRATEAAELADREGLELLQRVAGHAPAATQAACYSVLAMALLLSGRCHDGAAIARIASDYASEAADDACQFRALGLLAASLAVNGEFSAATDTLSSAAALGDPHGWGRGAWPAVLATVLIDHRQGDVEEMRDAVRSLDGNGADVVERSVVKICQIWLRVTGEDFRGMAVAANGVTHGVDRRLCPPLLLDMATSLECLALIQLGDPVAALRTIEGRTSPSGHSICFELLRASSYLALAEPRKVLQATDECIFNCPDHNMRTLPSVRLRRAVAFELLGLEASADVEYSHASHLAAGLGAVSRSVGLPLDVLGRLYHRLMRNEPEFGRHIAVRIPPNADYPDPQPLGFVPVHLTERERVVAGWLSTELTLAEIGGNLHVSVNTLKSQLRSLYRKLDVSSREDAVRSLLARGIIPPRPSGPAS